MANTQSPFGFQVFQSDGKQNRVREYAKAAGIIYAGDAVKMTSAGDVTVAAAGDVILGVSAEYKASADTTIAVLDDPDATFIGQVDASFALTDVGQNANITANAGDASLKRSTQDIDVASFGGSASLQFKILELLDRPGNEVGSFAIIVVKPNNHFYANGVTGV